MSPVSRSLDLPLLILLLTGLLAIPALSQPSWKSYPFDLEPGHPEAELRFPEAEASHPNDMSDSWFVTGTLQGQSTGRKYQFVTIFDRNDITAVILDFYQVSLFDLGNGAYGTFTDYDLPVIDILDRRLHFSNDYLNLGFDSSAGHATWANVLNASGLPTPFVYNVHLPGVDSQSNKPFSIDLVIDMQNEPVPFGADVLRGIFTFYAQKGTHTYFQTGPKMNGTVTFLDGTTEKVEGTKGHVDRQWFPLYSGIFTPTGRQHSHEWRQINFDNGEDFSIWRQFDRVNNNTVIEDTGATNYDPTGSPMYVADDLQVEYRSYAKYPRSKFSTLIPPPSQNMYLPSGHILTSETLGMNLSVNYVQPIPAVTLPIEYFEGPATYIGTLHGQPASGTGIFESTFALYRDWELVDVLSNSVAHLPSSSFSPSGPGASALRQLVDGAKAYVSSNLLKDNRVAAKAYLESKVRPALGTLVNAQDKATMLEILDDLEASFALVLQF